MALILPKLQHFSILPSIVPFNENNPAIPPTEFLAFELTDVILASFLQFIIFPDAYPTIPPI